VNIGDTYYAQAGQTLTIDFILKNNGSDSINADIFKGKAIFLPPSLSFTFILNPSPPSVTLPTGGICTTMENAFQVVISSSASPGHSCQFNEMYYTGSAPSGYSCDSSIFNMTIEVQ
jgi:hypothetical protein